MLFLKNVSPSAEVRAAIGKVSKSFSDADLKLENRRDLYEAFVQYRDGNKEEIKKMGKEDQRYLAKIIQDFELEGLNLPEDKKKRLTQIKSEIHELERQAEENIGEDKTKVEVDEKNLDGLE